MGIQDKTYPPIIGGVSDESFLKISAILNPGLFDKMIHNLLTDPGI